MDGQKGVPWVSRMTWFWAVVFTLFTCGIFALALALYLAFWVRLKRKRGASVYVYASLALFLLSGLLPTALFVQGIQWNDFSTPVSIGVVLLWIVGGFLLRREFMSYYASPEGGVLEMNPWLTGLFSVYYLNYCLWVVRDSA
jgi:hypothetical protein